MGGSGTGNGAPVAPLDSNQEIFRQGQEDDKEPKAVTNHPPVGLVNVGNTCYANAALQCLLISALSHALLNPASTPTFRQYSSNPDLLSMGSGSVDTDDDEDFFCSSPGSASHKSTCLPETTTSKKISDTELQKKRANRLRARHLRREKARKIRGKLSQRRLAIGSRVNLPILHGCIPPSQQK
mmetsp:Transcript_32006/g.38192  ORF Transcript_32006/g.38192 Transcript_32006/m.38192 type:complete len:183 (-) Transcript_32006:325-873(-)|eukprot:CAMPEP_0198277284 /NCGR_PEP_ID=MMETSP1447-20131203/65768_1 /TAXON_ID=420782 /ORGANISM="Chaetoceros dichaeta, Strain CCMP1751" /LENGTH=182 /DNA_ID=CAMNT_0043972297 /DNA_START=837 /DNA_END=1385 /DNA_ORIENTATION=-